MKQERLQFYFFMLLIAGIGAVMVWLLSPYLLAVGMAAVLAVLFYPTFAGLRRRLKLPSLAAALTTLLISLIVVAPLIVIGTLLLNEATALLSGSDQSSIERIMTVALPLQEKINAYVPGNYNVDLEQAFYEAVNWMTRNVAGVFASTANFILLLFVGIMALYYFLKDGSAFVKTVMQLSPLEDRYDQIVLEKLRRTISSVVKGTLIIALLQGLLAGVGFTLFGLSNPVLWGSVAAIGALVPSLGTGIVLAPAVVYLFAIGHIGAAVGLAVWGFLVIGLIDNVSRPFLVGRGVDIHPLLILLSVLGGISALGPSGILFGPIITSLFLVLCDIYIEFRHQWTNGANG